MVVGKVARKKIALARDRVSRNHVSFGALWRPLCAGLGFRAKPISCLAISLFSSGARPLSAKNNQSMVPGFGRDSLDRPEKAAMAIAARGRSIARSHASSPMLFF